MCVNIPMSLDVLVWLNISMRFRTESISSNAPPTPFTQPCWLKAATGCQNCLECHLESIQLTLEPNVIPNGSFRRWNVCLLCVPAKVIIAHSLNIWPLAHISSFQQHTVIRIDIQIRKEQFCVPIFCHQFYHLDNGMRALRLPQGGLGPTIDPPVFKTMTAALLFWLINTEPSCHHLIDRTP